MPTIITEHLQLVLLELKRQKKAETFPDGVYGQANRIMCSAGDICNNVRKVKVGLSGEHNLPYLKQSLISTMATCLRMMEEMEK